MTIDELKEKIRPDIESTFGGVMANVLFTKARVRVMGEGKGMDENGRCKLFLECIGSDEKFVGMLGAAGARSKVTSWMSYIR
ncbi:MAG: hypothetical protein COW32_03745 [Candidatus Aquicultor secundus]|uniref:hypothetical protein n=1 Tax=Candidatus Aquicultor secundus TaxID=1973895 RepID=UPI00090EC30B|nr:hypothetical protein [Candidatus Aquicultor secundus]OIO83596.1 MAG: hypothetical protein AUK32_09765 [Candidatus Aquicultor secundus]PIW22601.1 MAG: hypothetical protein COW32_03745 [Candidatus Aquicultor secundus]